MPGGHVSSGIEVLRGRPMLAEKVGQTPLVRAGPAVTGSGGPLADLRAIRTGGVGAIGDLCGRGQTRKAQRAAAEDEEQRAALKEARPGIPLPSGMDVTTATAPRPRPVAETRALARRDGGQRIPVDAVSRGRGRARS